MKNILRTQRSIKLCTPDGLEAVRLLYAPTPVLPQRPRRPRIKRTRLELVWHSDCLTSESTQAEMEVQHGL